MSKLFVLTIVLVFSATSQAQELPRWPVPSNIQVLVSPQFDSKEQNRVNAAIQPWRPLLPAGLTLTSAGVSDRTCQGCVTIIRETPGKERGQTEFAHHKWITDYAIIRIDPRVSGDDLEQTVQHEIGHALGLSHRPNSVMAMHAPDSIRIGFWKIKGKTFHPDERDREQLRNLYAQVPVVAAPVTVEVEAPTDVLTTAPAQRYSFRRVVTIGNKRRESTFTFNDKGEQVETDVVGSNDKAFKRVPMFPVGLGSEAVFNDWRTRPAVNRYVVRWENGKELSIDGAGDEALRFPVVAHTDKIRVEFFNYKLFRTSVSVKELEP